MDNVSGVEDHRIAGFETGGDFNLGTIVAAQPRVKAGLLTRQAHFEGAVVVGGRMAQQLRGDHARRIQELT